MEKDQKELIRKADVVIDAYPKTCSYKVAQKVKMVELAKLIIEKGPSDPIYNKTAKAIGLLYDSAIYNPGVCDSFDPKITDADVPENCQSCSVTVRNVFPTPLHVSFVPSPT